MITNEHLKKCETILYAYGVDSQVDMTIEEMAELTHVLSKAKRGKAENDAIRSEIADVLVMTAQLARWFGVEEVSNQIDYKLDRQLQRIVEEGLCI